jgi:hypothetical protein
MPHPDRSWRALVWVVVALLAWPRTLTGYSILSHETIIDSAWKTDLRPLLLKRFPEATHLDLRQAHACAYGGAIIQDLGYFPYGRKFFSNLTHYVRSGDFIQAMLRDAHDLCEYSFALGALAHYAADNQGHRLAVNLSVPILYPRLKRKYGDVVTYEDDPAAHLKTEFGFDVIEVAQERFAPDAYHDFIGFEVAQPLLDRAFRETYGLELSSVLHDERRAIGSYRHAISKTIPKATRVAWALKKNEIQRDLPSMTRKRFLYNISRASYEKNWGKDYRAPSAGEKVLAFLFRLIPKVGPLKALALHTPTPQTEQLFERSFNATLAEYRRLLSEWDQGRLVLVNDNFDVGRVTAPGQYELSDKTYAELLDELARQRFAGVSPELRADILQFYSDPNAPYATRRHRKEWNRLQEELQALRTAAPVIIGEEIP